MFQTTVCALMRGEFRREVTDITKDVNPNISEHCIYLFRDGELVLYVGQSKDVLARVEGHIGVGAGNDFSTVGRLIRANIPSSYDWLIEFFTMQECVETYWKNREQVREVVRCPLPYLSVDDAERSLIQYYNPCLNLAYSPGKRHLPSTYVLPPNALLDGITYVGDVRSLRSYRVSYRAFNWRVLENTKYEVTMYAPTSEACRALVELFLGYYPDELYVSLQHNIRPDDVPF